MKGRHFVNHGIAASIVVSFVLVVHLNGVWPLSCDVMEWGRESCWMNVPGHVGIDVKLHAHCTLSENMVCGMWLGIGKGANVIISK